MNKQKVKSSVLVRNLGLGAIVLGSLAALFTIGQSIMIGPIPETESQSLTVVVSICLAVGSLLLVLSQVIRKMDS